MQPGRTCFNIYSVDHERTRRSPKTGGWACAHAPVFGDPFNFREVLIFKGEELNECLLQLKPTAYEMRNIIKGLLPFAQVSKAEHGAELCT
jgi:hypothetical protein